MKCLQAGFIALLRIPCLAIACGIVFASALNAPPAIAQDQMMRRDSGDHGRGMGMGLGGIGAAVGIGLINELSQPPQSADNPKASKKTTKKVARRPQTKEEDKPPLKKADAPPPQTPAANPVPPVAGPGPTPDTPSTTPPTPPSDKLPPTGAKPPGSGDGPPDGSGVPPTQSAANPPPQTTTRPNPPTPQDPKDVPKPPVDPQDIAWECDEPICVGGLTRQQVAGMMHDGCVRTEKVLSFLELPGSIEDNLNKASGPARVYLDFFSGKDGASNRDTLKGWLIKIKNACKEKIALICEKCDAKTLKIAYSYTYGGSGVGGALNGIFRDRKIHLCVPQWCNAKGQTPRGQAGQLLHELSHLVGTDDMTGKPGEKVEFTAQGLTEKLIPTLSDAFDRLAPSPPVTAAAGAMPPSTPK